MDIIESDDEVIEYIEDLDVIVKSDGEETINYLEEMAADSKIALADHLVKLIALLYDAEVVQDPILYGAIIEELGRHNCMCKIGNHKNDISHLCPCDKFRNEQKCIAGLFIKKEN